MDGRFFCNSLGWGLGGTKCQKYAYRKETDFLKFITLYLLVVWPHHCACGRSENNLQAQESILSFQHLGVDALTHWAISLAQEAGFEDACIRQLSVAAPKCWSYIHDTKSCLVHSLEDASLNRLMWALVRASLTVLCHDDLMAEIHWEVTGWNRKLESTGSQPSFL